MKNKLISVLSAFSVLLLPITAYGYDYTSALKDYHISDIILALMTCFESLAILVTAINLFILVLSNDNRQITGAYSHIKLCITTFVVALCLGSIISFTLSFVGERTDTSYYKDIQSNQSFEEIIGEDNSGSSGGKVVLSNGTTAQINQQLYEHIK